MRRFGDQYDIVRTAQRRYRRAGCSGRRVIDGGDAILLHAFTAWTGVEASETPTSRQPRC